MVRTEAEAPLAQELPPAPPPADVPLPIFRSSFLRVDFVSVEVHMQHAELWFDGPAFVDDKGRSLPSDFLHGAASLLCKSVFGPSVHVTVWLMGPYQRAAARTDDGTLTRTDPDQARV